MGQFSSSKLGNACIADIAHQAYTAGFTRSYSALTANWARPFVTQCIANYAPGYIHKRAKYTVSPFAPKWMVDIVSDKTCTHTHTQHREQVLHSAVRRLASFFHLPLSHDKDGIFLKHGKEKYHIDTLQLLMRTDISREHKLTHAREIERTAIDALRKRAAEKIQAIELAAKAKSTYVSVDDSYRAGNCVPMTNSFATQMWSVINAQGECAVRADIILATRKDSYTLRAVYAAQNR